jgi:hypothetical protein
LSVQHTRSLSNYQFLTAKPILVIINIAENQIAQAAALDAEAEEFHRVLGLNEPALEHVIQLSYHLLGLISFFTTVSPN